MAHPGSTVDIIELGERQGQLKRKKKLLILQHVQYMLCYRKEQVTAIHLFRELSPPGYTLKGYVSTQSRWITHPSHPGHIHPTYFSTTVRF